MKSPKRPLEIPPARRGRGGRPFSGRAGGGAPSEPSKARRPGGARASPRGVFRVRFRCFFTKKPLKSLKKA